VMAHESFEDEAIAAELNTRFVNVKVDREERPDVDAVYMKAVQGMTGRGGWPMSVFLTPDGEPFLAGTYFPPDDRHGMPSFRRVLTGVSETWRDRRDEVVASAGTIAASIATADALEVVDGLDAVGVTREAADLLLQRAWDRELGGFGRAPKFPQAMTIAWLIARHDRTGEDLPLRAAVQALDAMARGGINDLVGGGFARYSTDARWLVPHFEKMLYDNALLVPAFAAAAARTGERSLVMPALETVEALLTSFATADGTFVAAFDADTAGEEGLTYVWTDAELREVVVAAGHDPDRFARFLGVSPEGNWPEGGPGVNVLHHPVPLAEFAAAEGLGELAFASDWSEVRAALRARRDARRQPGVDDKVLTDWNALAIVGLVRAGRAADALHATAVATAADGTVRVRHTAGVDGFLEDHAGLALAELELLAATGEMHRFERALALATAADARFADPAGGWFQTAADGERLIARPKETWDNATPAGSGVMAEVCRRLYALTGDGAWWDRADLALRALADGARRMPTGYGNVLRQLEEEAAGRVEVVIVGAPGLARDRLEIAALHAHHPGALVLVAPPDHGDRIPLLAHRGEVDGNPAAYVCRDMVCERPVTDPDELKALLAAAVAEMRRAALPG
ncbi:MAG: thioredoxin domain-containing protein, partial [Nitriliruptoraceae bacterium]